VPNVAPVVIANDEKENKFSWSAGASEQDSPDDDLPKFNITPTLSFAEIKDIEVKTANQKKKVVKVQKEIKEETPVQSSLEGLFLPKSTFNKLVIIADDTTRKSLAADFQKAGITQISEMQEVYISDLTKTLKSMTESLLLADGKLFGEGE
jgi:N-glycosylase/DNA lyase